MKIEKINENKLKITFNYIYLEENNIDIHSFMSNSEESQELLWNILEQAKDDLNFITDNYKLSIQTIYLSDGNFIITVTKVGLEEEQESQSPHINGKENNTSEYSIYQFSNIKNLNLFINFVEHLPINFPESIYEIYQLDNYLFLIIDNEKIDYNIINKISIILEDFSTPVSNSEIFYSKIKECGNLITDFQNV